VPYGFRNGRYEERSRCLVASGHDDHHAHAYSHEVMRECGFSLGFVFKKLRMAKLLKQYGALPVMEISGALHVLLITSRVTHRWIIPKGHPEKKMRPSAAAVLEAREEAGVSGAISKTPIGRYRTRKCLASGKLAPCEVTVFRLDVSEHLAEWKERLERKIMWVPLGQAVHLVDDGGLSRFLENLDVATVSKASSQKAARSRAKLGRYRSYSDGSSGWFTQTARRGQGER
jgi:8-oxo-dGTP pyrophosphatase MutT (NUDIX family)